MSENVVEITTHNQSMVNTSESPRDHHFVPNLKLIPDQGVAGEVRPEIPIGVTHFQRGEKTLDFVNVAHTGVLSDLVHRTVDAAITTRNPQLIITEGHPTYTGSDSNSITQKRGEIIRWTRDEVNKVKQNKVQDPSAYIPEAGYAAYVAAEQNIPSIGGEPTGRELFEGMRSRITPLEPQGYPPEAIIADAFMRQIQRIPLDKRRAMNEEEFIKNFVPELLTEANERVDPLHTMNVPPLTIDQFREWYIAHPLSGNRRFMDVDYSDFEPHQNGSYSQVMACESGVVRDQHIAKLVAEFLNKKGNDRLILIYGLDHLPSLRPVFEDEGMFGSKGEFIQLVEEDQVATTTF